MKIRNSEQIKVQILEMHNQGYTVSQMATVLGLTADSVNARRKRMGLKRYCRKISDGDRAKIKKMHRDGLDRQAIADYFGLARSSINRVLRNTDTGAWNITQGLQDPINKFLTSRWTTEDVRSCLA